MGRQEWNRRAERDRDVLERILALLPALADLVDHAASLPAAKRLHLLAILGHGEAEARSFIMAMASEAGASARFDAASDAATVTPVPEVGDAALLAARFRVLALALGVLLATARGRSPCRHASPAASREPHLVSQFTPSPALRATSPPQAGERSRSVADDATPRTGARAPVAIGARLPATIAIGAPLPRAGGEVAREA